MITIAKTVAAVALALPLALASFGAPAAQEEGDCITGRQIQQAINDGDIVDLADAMQAEGVRAKPLSQPDVCRVGGQLKYRVNIMNSYGEAERIVLNAQGN
jgi:hypothetical protein